jgi:hypothetical protein
MKAIKRSPKSAVQSDLNVCANCHETFTSAELEELTHGFWERVSPGEIMPSGECPKCHALCYPTENELSPFIGAIKKVVETVAATGGLLNYPSGNVAPVGAPDWLDLGDAILACLFLLTAQGIKIKLATRSV